MKENIGDRNSENNGMLELAALGFAAMGVMLIAIGANDYDFGHKVLSLPEISQNPNALAIAKTMMERGLVDLGLGITSLSVSASAVSERVKK